MKVPRKEYAMTVPKLEKKGFLFMLNPASKMIGGRSKIMNKLLKCLVKLVIWPSILNNLKRAPAKTPISTVRPDSCRYLCLDFLR